MISKNAVIAALRTALRAELQAVSAMTALARDEATHGDTKAEGKYDTRATEASYLAAGQGARLAEIKRLMGWFEVLPADRRCTSVELGALVCVEDHDERRRWVFMAPDGGTRVAVSGVDVAVISPASRLGSALVGLVAGDGAEVDGPSGLREILVEAVL